jgi:predicted AlkP superfamily phosphohydrolase/phosphomutase
MKVVKKVLVIGLDGLEPSIVEPLLAARDLPAFDQIRERGGYARVRTTCPAQTPVAWSTFATGVNPGGHGIFDFIGRDPKTYLPNLALNRYEQKNTFLPPRAVNLRRGTPVWEILSAAGIPSSILRCPCTFPPDSFDGRMLAGMGVPDLRGSFGTGTFYSSGEVKQQESESFVHVARRGDTIQTKLLGPRNPRTRDHFTAEITLKLQPTSGRLTVHSQGRPRDLPVLAGQWSDWLRVRFKTGLLQSVMGMMRFHLVRFEPEFELYASPINFDPEAPQFPISAPPEFAQELATRIGPYYTTGMVEDHAALNNGRIDETAFLDQCALVLAERESMLRSELERFREGLLFCLFDTPDRLQHMFWRYREPDHPANQGSASKDQAAVIQEHYRACDAIVARVLAQVDDKTLVIVLSDHGFGSFRRGINLNTWLLDQGLLALRAGVQPGEEAGSFFRHVDWSRTRAFAVGLGGIYLNCAGREAQGVVKPAEVAIVTEQIAQSLSGLEDPERGQVAVRAAVRREQVYSGPYVNEAPDLIVLPASGYRVSWGTTLGGVPCGHFEDNVKKWSGDHIVDPALVPGILFLNRPFRPGPADLVDLAPTILAALGVPRHPVMEGESLLL